MPLTKNGIREQWFLWFMDGEEFGVDSFEFPILWEGSRGYEAWWLLNGPSIKQWAEAFKKYAEGLRKNGEGTHKRQA